MDFSHVTMIILNKFGAFPVEGDVELILTNRSEFSILDNLSLFLISYSTFSNAIQLTVLFPNSTGADRQFLKLNASSKAARARPLSSLKDRHNFLPSLMTSSVS